MDLPAVVVVTYRDTATVAFRHELTRRAVEAAPPVAARTQYNARAPRGPKPTTRANPAGLTDRQVEILRLLVAGRTLRRRPAATPRALATACVP
jgi:hypothetical protein